MNIQKSFAQTETGTLYVVPTPIGNLEDMTFRAINTLTDVSLIAAEDTRHTKNLLRHFNINTPLISYHEHNKKAREHMLLQRLKEGDDIAIVSDAGMPAISDPGHDIIQAAIEEQISVVVLPGANAALCALVGSGLSTNQFIFYGFLPRKKKEKQAELERLQRIAMTLIFYESPFRVKETVKTIQDVFGESHRIVLARELTKRFEEYTRGTVREVLEWIETQQLKGEYCIIVEKSFLQNDQTSLWWSELTIEQHVNHYINDGLSTKDAIKHVAHDRQLPKRTVYQTFHN
ncbi:16S rRNA (cytidine1402-2'-O)-methyltransferase [Cerasibacillus quisquiliarum]|uniref:Ribosomal RNA small subunit methyltransferase I n=1 Tax=Cerasibacillus quisquiliarum TaxID=227865 RepID=A0A511V0L8_9BACI|nr:16S rRNA (cytidine(1402)-2'-O)-methyltransferase [Cerasibacillus quisquiliarum]MBB5146564.1 16S rRNA (cytidine1402-2'-O)-methyltransferase [Cerasibacillus quisquiliarum]GEN31263.1 ribosomal RNA small subunit methyltransferase I [Cerasibacillus quisquiliarum]